MIRQGRKTQFRALVVMGNGRGAAGFGVGKGNRPRTALVDAQKNCVKDIVVMRLTSFGSLFHETVGEYNNTKVMIRQAPEKSGVKAGHVVSAVCDCLGIRNVASKVIGRKNPFTVMNATFAALGLQETPAAKAYRLGRKFVDASRPQLLSKTKI